VPRTAATYQNIMIVSATRTLIPTASRPTMTASSTSMRLDSETLPKVKDCESLIHIGRRLERKCRGLLAGGMTGNDQFHSTLQKYWQCLQASSPMCMYFLSRLEEEQRGQVSSALNLKIEIPTMKPWGGA
jgi:hypothetical protein